MIRRFDIQARIDYETCLQLFLEDGYVESDLTILSSNETWLFDENKGFFTLRMVRGIPYIQHFIVSKKHRDFVTGWQMWRTLKKLLRERGHKYFYVSCPKDAKRAKTMTRLFRKKPYTEKDGHLFWAIILERSRNHASRKCA